MNIDEIMPRRVAYNEYVLESVGTVIVSTIQLPAMYTSANPGSKYETAIIWDQVSPEDDGYHIDWIGFTEATALEIHQSWCCPTKLAGLIRMKVTAKRN